MDITDQANDLVELLLTKSLENINPVSPAYSGFCLFCGDECGQARYCDRYCREDHEAEIKRRK